MSEKGDFPDNKGLKKKIGEYTIYLGRSCDFVNGKGWFAQVWCGWYYGTAFHKKNKFTAIRNAIKMLKHNQNQ